MAARAHENIKHALIWNWFSGAIITAQFVPLKFGVDEFHVVPCTSSNDPAMIGWSHYAVAAAGQTAGVILNGVAIIKAIVAAGGTATAGNYAIGVAGATTYKDALALNGGANFNPIAGRFLQSGVPGDAVGMLIGGINPYALTA